MTEQETLQFVYDIIESEEKRYIELNKDNPDILDGHECGLLLDNLNNLRNTIKKKYNEFRKEYPLVTSETSDDELYDIMSKFIPR